MARVVIIGGGITGLAAAWELQQQGVDYILLEAANRLGGKIMTERTTDGFVIEGAADSFLTQKPAAWQLCQEAGLTERMIGTNTKQRSVYVLRDGKLQLFPRGMRLLVPTDPAGILESTVLSDEGKRQMLAETEVPSRCESGDESLASFVRRRFGQEALDVFGEPLLAGIYVGNPETLSMEAIYPSYLALEQKYGSVTKGTLATPLPAPPAGAPPSAFVSFRGGMVEMIEGLAARLTGDIRLGVGVESISADGTIFTSTGEAIKPKAVILTTPARIAAKLVSEVVPTVSQMLQAVRTVSSATVSLGFRAEDVSRSPDGYGFIVPRSEPTRLVAGTWNSTKLAGRAPTDSVLMRAFFGGHGREEDVNLTDEQLVHLAYTELQAHMGFKAAPVISRVFRWRGANTQYEVGHVERVAQLKSLCPPWLALTGAPYGGVGIPDCVRQGRETARLLIQK